MLLNISSLFKNSDLCLDFDDEIEIDNSQFNHKVVTFSKPVKVSGTVKNVGGVLILKQTVSGEYETFCDRCMEPVTEEINIEFEENFVKELSADDDTANILENENIDVSDITFRNIFSEIPLKHLCNDECKGICHNCGANLNISQCSCENEEWNPQFEILKHLFD